MHDQAKIHSYLFESERRQNNLLGQYVLLIPDTVVKLVYEISYNP